MFHLKELNVYRREECLQDLLFIVHFSFHVMIPLKKINRFEKSGSVLFRLRFPLINSILSPFTYLSGLRCLLISQCIVGQIISLPFVYTKIRAHCSQLCVFLVCIGYRKHARGQQYNSHNPIRQRALMCRFN